MNNCGSCKHYKTAGGYCDFFSHEWPTSHLCHIGKYEPAASESATPSKAENDSSLQTTQEKRDKWDSQIWPAPYDLIYPLIHDANRAAALERDLTETRAALRACVEALVIAKERLVWYGCDDEVMEAIDAALSSAPAGRWETAEEFLDRKYGDIATVSFSLTSFADEFADERRWIPEEKKEE